MKSFNLGEYLANPSRKVITRDGRKARIICTNAKNNYPIVALIETPIGKEGLPCVYKKDGTYLPGEKLSCDLFFAPEKHEGWVNIHKVVDDAVSMYHIWSTEEDAKKEGTKYDNYVATVKIEWEE